MSSDKPKMVKQKTMINKMLMNVDVKLNNLKYKLKLRDEFEIKHNRNNDMFILVSAYDSNELTNIKLNDYTIMRMETFEYMKLKNMSND